MTKQVINLKLIILLINVVFFLASCSGNGDSKTQEEVFLNDSKSSKNDEIVITDQDFNKNSLSTDHKKLADVTQVAADGSKINIAYDAFGNKTETRCFNNSRLKCLVLRTLADGRREIFVFGQNGQTKNLPEEMLDRALTASAEEIANKARIYTAFKATTPIKNQSNQSLNSVFVQRNQPVKTAESEQENTENAQVIQPPDSQKETTNIIKRQNEREDEKQ